MKMYSELYFLKIELANFLITGISLCCFHFHDKEDHKQL